MVIVLEYRMQFMTVLQPRRELFTVSFSSLSGRIPSRHTMEHVSKHSTLVCSSYRYELIMPSHADVFYGYITSFITTARIIREIAHILIHYNCSRSWTLHHEQQLLSTPDKNLPAGTIITSFKE